MADASRPAEPHVRPANDPPHNDPSYNVFSSGRRQPLDAIFDPQSVAVIGASEAAGSVGRTLLWNLISNPFGGTVYPVNPSRKSALGVRAYDCVADVPEPVDLAVIATPARTVPSIIAECAEAGVPGAVIISAGFREVGEAGAALEREILETARAAQMRIIGPNCLGVMRPTTGLNATFAGAMARPGRVGFISQSGAMMTSVLDYSYRENIGFSAFISIGSMMDVNWGDLIYYLGEDPATESIMLYMESVGDARAFLSAAREVALQKPIIVIKAGRTEAAAQAAASHTGTLAGSDAVLDAAFRRVGVVRVDRISDLFYMAEAFSKQPRPEGPRLTIVTNAGGPGVLTTDGLIRGGGGLTELSEETIARFDALLPAAWSHANPVDILGDAPPERYARALEIAAEDAASDGLLVVLTPQAMTDPTETARRLAPHAHVGKKPVLASWMGGRSTAEGEQILNDAGIPTFGYPDTAARVFNYMWRYSYNLRALYETPSLPADEAALPARDRAEELLTAAQAGGRTLLTEHASKQLLAAYGIPTVETHVAATVEEAAARAEALGYPVVVKLHSTTLTHKTDVGGVKLDLADAEAVRAAFEAVREGVERHGHVGAFDGVTVQPMIDLGGYELIVGSSLDAQFGPVILFGTGGTLVEVFEDRALGLPPLSTTLARRMMEQTRIYEALGGVRGQAPVDLEALQALMVRFSQLVVEQPAIKEIDINPLLASPERIVALDARVVLHGAGEGPPRPAIRPYPRRYVGTWQSEGGAEIMIRPIRPEDEPLLVAFHRKLSERSVYLRYASLMQVDQRVAHQRLARICFNDYDREIALVAERDDPESSSAGAGAVEIVGVGRLTKLFGTNDGEFAMLVADEVQRQGIGTELLRRLVRVGRDEGLDHILADILTQNTAMQRVCRKLGFEIIRSPDYSDPMVKAVKVL